jgi:hypothetical protein
MSCDHSNETSSRQIETLAIFKIVICNKIKYRDHSVHNRFQNCYVYHRQNQSGLKIPLGITVLGQCNAKLNPQRVQTFFFPSEKNRRTKNATAAQRF